MSLVDWSGMANAIRFISVDAIVRATEGHQGVPLGMAEAATALFARHMKFNPQDPLWPDRDRFVLSNGHGSMLLYSLLYLSGYEAISLDQIRSFREMGSRCPGHPEYAPAHGIEVTTGPLGQGIANAVGMAVAEAYQSALFGPEVVDHRTYAFVGDGCLEEGIGQEAISLAGHLQLGKLTFFWDDNHITDDGRTELALSEDVRARFRVGGWQVIDVDGHDIEAISAAITLARADPRPSMIACRTVIARGIARLEGQRGGHSARLYPEDAAAMRERLGGSSGPFEIAPEILAAWRTAAARSAPAYAAWKSRLAALAPEKAETFRRIMSGERPSGWREAVRAYKRRVAEGTENLPGINASGDVSEVLTDIVPEMIIGCADLEAPTNHKRRRVAFTPDNRGGSYVHCGVREHVMGAMANGMAAHGGTIPLSVTYLAFSDYQRPALRMAALMGLPTIFVFSHDSIGVGKNGPTHQPVEILASLRAMPNLLLMRPADAVEVAECWEIALEQTHRPIALALSRQPLGASVRAYSPENACRRGAYVLKEAACGARRATLLATGSEVAVALKAREALEAQGVPTAVVSMPCWALFEEQDAAYRDGVLAPGTVRVGVEAACRLGWDRYIGETGGFAGMAGFGASGPVDALFEHFGITAAHVVAEVTCRL